ncbi:hypothetical protein FPOAC2_13294 [Fusarium poae]
MGTPHRQPCHCTNSHLRHTSTRNTHHIHKFDRNTEHIAVGDYNLHHELWGGINIRKPDPQASELIELMDNYDLASQLPAGTMTYEEGEKCLTTIDLTDRIIRCEIDDEVNRDSDHLPIVACHTGNVT